MLRNREKPPAATVTLVKRCKQGDQDSFQELFTMFKDSVYSTALRILGNKHNAEDATQDTFIKIFTNIHTFRSDSPLLTWIYRITINTCYDLLNSRRKFEKRTVDAFQNELPALSSHEETPGVVQIIIESEIQKLPKGCRAVFILHAIEGFKHDEVAKILDISPGTSKSQYFAAKSILRKQLIPYKEAFINEL